MELHNLISFPDLVAFGNCGYVQSSFGWAYYNMQSFHWNVYMRQMQKYQQKNYNVVWTYIARRDILNMMGITVQRMSNYMVASAILFTVAAIIAMSAKFLQQTNPFQSQLDTFIILAFYVCICAANVLFIAAILIAVEGQNLAFTETMKLLTFHVRPENPADYNHDYMKQAQWIEKLGLASLFRVPGLMPNYEENSHVEGLIHEAREGGQATTTHSKGNLATHAEAAAEQLRVEDLTVLENCDIKTTHAAYLGKYAEFARQWVCYDEYSKYCVGVACIELAQGLLCWVFGWLVAKDYWWYQISGACWAILMTSLLSMFFGHFKVFESRFRFLLYGTVVTFNCMLAIAASSPLGWVKELLYPICFFVHFAMFCVILLLGKFDSRVLAEQPTIKKGFWGSNEKWYGSSNPTESYDESRGSTEHGLEQHQRPLDDNPAAPDEVNLTGDIDNRTFGSFQELEVRVRRNINGLRRIIRAILFGFMLFWLGLTLGSAHYAWIEYTDQWGSPSSTQRAQVHENFTVGPNYYLLLQAITCTENKTFVSDGYSVLQKQKNSWTDYPCHEKGVVLDLVTSCDAQDCWPVALIRAESNSSILLDCKTGEVMHILQEATPATHVAVKYELSPEEGLKQQKLIAEHTGKVIQYRWSTQRAGWEPEWRLVHDRSFWSAGQGTPQILGLDTSRKYLSVFRDAEVGSPAIKRYDLGTMEFSDQWTLNAPAMGGCVLDKDGLDMLVLLNKDDAREGAPDLMRISLNS